MKREISICVIFIIVCIAGCNSGRSKAGAGTVPSLVGGDTADISFREYEHDFGKVTEGEKVAYIFRFDNKGPGTLAISSVATTCGCTVTKYDRNPVAPGKSGMIEVEFDTSARQGMQTKTISVKSNSRIPVVILKITAEVVPRKN
ncbi:MAG: DUF1573 domain-containing protein [Bacteroidales bacterium]